VGEVLRLAQARHEAEAGDREEHVDLAVRCRADPRTAPEEPVTKAIMEIPVETAWSMYNFRADEVVANIAPRPVLFFHTANDGITPTEQSIRMFEKAGTPAELMLVTGTSHFPLSEQDAPRTKSLIKSWLDKFFPSPLGTQA
jgi:pimeloyl-ACP methyl ester carboxylesterase